MKVIRREQGAAGGEPEVEASILKKLRHPGIPVLYDYGEDDECICLIEEFVRGLSLKEYFLYHPVISSEQIISYVIALCDIIEYLHSDAISIIYQDLKPEHVIIRDGRIMLIDYGISKFLTHSCHTHRIAGTIDYMPPESIAGISDEKNDIYALGIIARQMLQHCDSPDSGRLMRLAQQALMTDPDMRPSGVTEWKERWVSLQKRRSTGCTEDHRHGKIAVIGSRNGIGCTHIAISLVCYLNSTGRRAIYENASGEAVCEHILSYGRAFGEKEGMIYHGNFTGMLDYFSARKDDTTPDGIFVLDCGTDSSRYAEADIIIYVVGSRLWKSGNVDKDIASFDNCFPVVSPSSVGVGLAFAKEIGRKAYAFPLDPDPFHVSAAKKKLFRQITGIGKNDIWTKERSTD